MELKGLWIDEKTGEIRASSKFKLFPSLKDITSIPETKEIILTKEEAEEWGIDLKKNPKGFYTKIDGIRVPINIKEKLNKIKKG